VVLLLAESSIAAHTSEPEERERLAEVALAVRDFSLGNDYAAMPTGEDYRTAITPDAISHLLDVRIVFVTSVLAFVVFLLAILVLLIIAIKRKKAATLAHPFIIGGILPLAAAALLGLAVAIDFGAFFTWMHGIFFADGTWTFPADSLLIRSLPFNFWFACAVVWAGCMALLCIISIATGMLISRRQKSSDRTLAG
jgi:integral membrane protein (TIGR01906 family)